MATNEIAFRKRRTYTACTRCKTRIPMPFENLCGVCDEELEDNATERKRLRRVADRLYASTELVPVS